ncbi:hypothetical protein [Actinoplanes sp. M2I2]|uniref:hypothetical protein n=1 Tax=Actinoplanes sp. M2I2 TaxID=1734444 RepID=UPI00202116EC|nr:hypothetical protein [Actinoplanes sp. M2I2]
MWFTNSIGIVGAADSLHLGARLDVRRRGVQTLPPDPHLKRSGDQWFWLDAKPVFTSFPGLLLSSAKINWEIGKSRYMKTAFVMAFHLRK